MVLGKKREEPAPMPVPVINPSEVTSSTAGKATDTFRRIIEEMSAISKQLDNTPLLRREKCRCLGGYYDEDMLFCKDKDRKAVMNEDGWNYVEGFLDSNTNVNAVVSIKDKDEIRVQGRIDGTTFCKNMYRNYDDYGMKLEDVEAIIIRCAKIAFDGQKRAIGGQTVKMINKIIKQIEQTVHSDNATRKRGIFGGGAPQ